MKFHLPCALALLVVAAVSATAVVEENESTAVLTRVYNGYQRAKDASGGYPAETFIFANGGRLGGGNTRDASIDDLPFLDLARLMAGPLRDRNYVTATDPKQTKLMILVFWGSTESVYDPLGAIATDNLHDALSAITGGAEGASADNALAQNSAANVARDVRNFQTARLLGYHQMVVDNYNIRFLGARHSLFRDLIAEVEEPRYFVILMAVDFQAAWKEKKLLPLWSAQYSIRTAGNNFTVALPDMTKFAARYFGRDSGGLVRRLNPTGKVNMDDVRILGEAVPGK